MDWDIGICTATLLVDPMQPTERDVRGALEAAAGVGFTHVSIWGDHLGVAGGRRGFETGRAVLDDLGLRASMVEGTTSWVTGEPPQWGPSLDDLLEAASVTGATHLLAACLEPSIPDEDVARRGLDDAVDAATRAGVAVCVEFLPWTGLPDLASAWRLVEPTGATLLIDAFHWQRQPGGPAPELLASIPPGRIGAVQLCDASAEPGDDVMAEAMTARLLPGDGVVDIDALVATIAASGSTPHVTAEVFNPAMVDAAGTAGTARRIRDACAPIAAR